MRNEKPSAQEDYEEAQAERREARQQGADNRSGGPSPNDPLLLIEPPKIRCDKCGAVNAADATKCSGCGTNLGTQPPPPKVGYMLGKTKLACNVGNVLLALKQEPTIMNVFAFDEMARTEILMRPLFLTEPEFRPRPVTDADVIKLQSWLQWRLEFKRLGKNTTRS
jgi:hypothetical protein